MSRRRLEFAVLFLAGLASAFLVVASTTELIPVTANSTVLGVLTGLILSWFFDLSRSLTRPSKEAPPTIVLTFDPELRASELAIAEKKIFGRPVAPNVGRFPSRMLLSADPALALAHVRIQLERALRSLAGTVDGGLDATRSSIRRLTEILLDRQVLPPVLAGPIQEVVEVCNKAVHGYAVAPSDAEAIVESGERIVTILEELTASRGEISANQIVQADG
jgi:hypothetical protein